uniref:Slam-dependent surface lipoprotein n=1 Tax=Providencia alcalifaciens TaxID=126385 RepID=UPI002B0604BC
MNKSTKVTLIAILAGVSTYASAVTESAQSQTYETERSDIRVAGTEVVRGPHGGQLGDPGVGHRSIAGGKTISLLGLTKMGTKTDEDVTIVNSGGPSNHSGMGKFQFAKVADAEIYYGDWSQTGAADDVKHTAFFSGLNATKAVPTEGKATYIIAGINQYDGEKKLSGVFEADFGDKDYTGSLQGENLKIALEGQIHGAGSFSGSAIANDTVAGMSYGRFFGDNAEHVGGVTVFNSDHKYDTAFGGSQTKE